MSTFWWKLILLQLLVTAIAHPTEWEFDKKPKLANERLIISLLNKVLEDDINDLNLAKGTNDRAGQIKYMYDVPYTPPYYYLPTEEKITLDKYDNLEPLFNEFQKYVNDGRVDGNRIKKSGLPGMELEFRARISRLEWFFVATTLLLAVAACAIAEEAKSQDAKTTEKRDVYGLGYGLPAAPAYHAPLDYPTSIVSPLKYHAPYSYPLSYHAPLSYDAHLPYHAPIYKAPYYPSFY
ncbi:Hypothetical protein CINCED_3A017408 [Cinara cedri]|uniref:Uncharacterized protein n=1 Tax=Cinara cedri TaxID=506608 RepID=A0A5E4M9X6_9HEMI|nr:Hypothetical protein CINCED_3A017408 [Cinara cedri]